MGLETTTTSNKVQTPLSPDGYIVGQSASDYVGFYGKTPIVQPTAAAQAAITDNSGGAAAPTNGILTLTGSYNSAIIANAIATIAAQTNAMRTVLVNLGLMKGS